MELSRDIARFARSRPVIECAQCGERIYIPEWSECVDGCRVRHLWQCDACGTSFETTVRFVQIGISRIAARVTGTAVFHGILRSVPKAGL